MSTTNHLAFDLGAESGRAVLGRLDSGRLTLTELHRFANIPVRMNGRLHWNLPAIWENLKQGLRQAAGGAIIHSLGIDTWGVDFGLLGEGGELLGLPVCYRDRRTDGLMERTFERVARRRIFEATGIQFLPFNTLFQLLAMRHCGSSALDAANRLLLMPDLLHYLFTGQAANEFSAASTTQMLDPRTGDWAWDLLTELDLPTRILGPVCAPGSDLGPLSSEVADDCGVRSDLRVITPAAHDTGSAVVAVPAEDGDKWCYISSGTWSLMGVELAGPVISDKSLRYNCTNEGGAAGTIRFLKNIMGLWLVQECRRHWAIHGQEHTYADLAVMAERARPFAALIDPDHPSFLPPGMMPGRIEEFCRRTGQAAPADKGQFVRACLEGLALAYRRTLDGLEDVLGRRIDVVHVVGGGSRNDLLNQMTADACGRPVVAGPAEATAIGNILCQALASSGADWLRRARAIVRENFEVRRYLPRDSNLWRKAYSDFLALTDR